MSRPILPPAAIEYPESDGKPMAENDPQLHAIHYAFGALLLCYAERDDVYVSADLLSHAEEHAARLEEAATWRAAAARADSAESRARTAELRAEAAEVRVAELEALVRQQGR